MKKLALILALAILLGAGAVYAVPGPSYAQEYTYPPPPADPYAYPWVGPSTPWVYYNGDWFLNGILYYFFGALYGWAPYYAYPYSYIVRPYDWYGPMWNSWYVGHPIYWQNFRRAYPYWAEHHEGEHYSREFYEEHHRGMGGGWQQGFKGVAPGAAGRGVAPRGTTRPEGRSIWSPEEQQQHQRQQQQFQQRRQELQQREQQHMQQPGYQEFRQRQQQMMQQHQMHAPAPAPHMAPAPAPHGGGGAAPHGGGAAPHGGPGMHEH